MKTQLKSLLLLAVAVCGLTSSVMAQSPSNLALELQRVRQQFNHPKATPGRYMPVQGNISGQQHRFHNSPAVFPQQQLHNSGFVPVQPYPQYQQYPVYVSPDQFNGINPYTGGINTKNEQVDNSYYDHHREASKNNGTRRWVRRPIYDTRGNIKGYQEGYVWTNSVTGVEHGELKNVTDNGKGGTHEQIQVRSVQ